MCDSQSVRECDRMRLTYGFNYTAIRAAMDISATENSLSVRAIVFPLPPLLNNCWCVSLLFFFFFSVPVSRLISAAGSCCCCSILNCCSAPVDNGGPVCCDTVPLPPSLPFSAYQQTLWPLLMASLSSSLSLCLRAALVSSVSSSTLEHIVSLQPLQPLTLPFFLPWSVLPLLATTH